MTNNLALAVPSKNYMLASGKPAEITVSVDANSQERQNHLLKRMGKKLHLNNQPTGGGGGNFKN